MPVLCLEDFEIRAVVMPNSNDKRVKLTLEYPNTPEYSEKVMLGLSEVLRPGDVNSRRSRTKSVSARNKMA